ncbi:MAG: metallopeptidase family protein [Bacillota bacterium]|nr:metallopeptidase family protein [Bacillota bacterium]
MEDKYGRLDEFEEILNEIYAEIPEKFFEDLNLGVVIEEDLSYHPKSQDNDLFSLGAYKRGPLGRGIVIYYGSFMKLFGFLPRELLKEKIRETFLHELQHHREFMARYADLEVEDAQYIKEYEDSKKL